MSKTMTPTPSEIRAHLAHILQSREFVASESISTLLEFVVEESLAGRADQIKGYTIAVNAFGRPAEFDPQINTLVRTHARRLRRALSIYYLTDGQRAPLRISIPKGSYVPRFQISGQVPTPSPQDPNAAATEQDPHLPFADADGRRSLPTEMSLAVAPLTNLSPGKEDVYFAAGLTEELVVALTRFPDLTVIGPLYRLDQQPLGPRQIGRAYGVRFVLQGTVRKRKHDLRISIKLHETARGRSLWANNYDFDLEAIPLRQIEENVTAQAVATIADAYGVIPRRLFAEVQAKPLKNSSVTEAILRYHYFHVTGTKDAFQQALEALRTAQQIAPQNPQVLATLADVYFEDSWLNFNLVPDNMNHAAQLARQALILDPGSQMAHVVMASIYAQQGQVADCITACRQAIKINPHNAHQIGICAYLLAMMGEWDEGLALLSTTKRLNPHYPSWFHHVTFMNYYRLGLYEEALVEAERVNLPTIMIDPVTRAAVLGQLGREEDATAALNELHQLVPDFPSRLPDLKRSLFFTDDNAEMLLDGLKKAGLNIPHQAPTSR